MNNKENIILNDEKINNSQKNINNVVNNNIQNNKHEVFNIECIKTNNNIR